MEDATNGEGQLADATPAKEKQPDRLAHPVAAEERPRLDFPVVGIGASAGGLEAFIEFFKAMPPDAGIAFVLIQHLSPDRESMVADILGKHTHMPVVQVEEHMPVRPNTVYVIRPGRTLTIKNGRLHLGTSLSEPGRNRPVDDFFRSLAEEQRERAIAIVLSGMGSNGTAGAEAVKAVGGVVIAQEPESAKFPSMPRMLMDSGNADYVLKPHEMPQRLLGYASHPYARGRQLAKTAAEQHAEAIHEIITVVRARTRRDFTGYKKPTVVRRIERRMGLSQIESLGEYATFLRQNPVETAALADDLMINVTGFFRDPEAWEVLRQKVIAPLLSEREAESSVRCWVTACSSGEEAYTLAMLLTEEAERMGKRFDIKVFATDTAERSLARARNGVYPLGIESEVAPDRLDRFFERDDATYRIRGELRELVVFAPQNVVQDPPFSRLDICTCRNLLIYLEPELQRRVLSLLHFGLHEGGALFLGSSESINGVEELFEPIDKHAHIFRRVSRGRHEAIDFAFPSFKRGNGGDAHEGRPLLRPSIAQQTQRTLLERFTPPSVTVDRQHRVVYFHGDTTPYLSQPSGEPTRDLFALVREDYRGAVRTALHGAVSENRLTLSRDGIVQTQEGRFRLEVAAAPLEGKGAGGHYLVSFNRMSELLPPVSDGEPAEGDAAEVSAELRRTKQNLQNAIEELQTTNEELRASHEEAMSVNEELQSANEELETSKEELQSLNEELTTVNVQLQTKMDEHESVVNDLNSLLSSTNIAVIFLDPRLRIRRFTPAATDLFELITSDIGRPLSDLHKKFEDERLADDCRAVLDKLAPVEREVRSPSGRIYMRRVQPYRTVDNRIDGVVITFIDVSALNVAQTAQRESEERFRQVIEGAQDFAMLLMDPEGKIVTWNLGAERLLGWSKNEAIGKKAAMIYVGNDADAQQAREMEKAARAGRAEDETWHQRKDGSQFWGSGMLTALRDNNGELTAFVKVMRDETARRDAEADRDQLLQREQKAREDAERANLVKDQFLARLSHELRTPLSSILTWAEMLQHRDMSDEQLAEGLRVIERSASSQKQLLDDLLDTSRIASGKLRLSRTVVEISQLTRQVVETLALSARERGVSLELHAADNVGQVLADPDRLRQVVINLVTNAIKFTPSGGRVDVHLERMDHHLELRVTDTGQGIDPEFLPHIFTPFSQADFSATRSYGGLGLGLAICRELVEMHGGTIQAHSDGDGRGSTFTVHLPLPTEQQLAETAIELEPIPSENAEALRGVNILLVENDRATRLAFVRMLESSGAQVTQAGTAEEAFDAFSQGPPDVIVSDIGMPQQDGYELLRRIRELERERSMKPTPAIALTAFAGPQHRRRAAAAGFEAHVAKPVRLASLVSTIARYTKKPN